MKRSIIIALLVSGVWAADFSQMSTEEMMKMRGSVPVDDRPAFQQEMQKRMQSMSMEERQKYMQKKGMGMGMTGKRNCGMRMQPTFEEYDLNSDGKITQSELDEARAKRMSQKAKEGKMLRNAGKAPAFSDMDKNKDGSLSPEEFQQHQMEQMKQWKMQKNSENCPSSGMGQGMRRNQSSFTEIDTNKDGVISQEEFSVHQTQRMKNQGNCPGGNCP